MNTKGRKIHSAKFPKKLFFTQREMGRFKLEEQIYPIGRKDPKIAHWILEGEILSGPSGSGIPSKRRCHQY